MSLDEKFKQAAADIGNLKAKPTDEELLDIYSLYKQATVGDNNIDRPGILDQKGRAKWDAWNARKGMSQDAAKEAYIQKADVLVQIYGKK